MKKLLRHTGVALALLATGACASAAVTVTYVNTEKMTDVPRFAGDRESMEWIFKEHLEKLGKDLPAGQDLKVEFLDIDLAGDVFPRVPIQDVRVMKGRADWPRMTLRYSLEQNGQVLRSGEEKLANPNYQMGINMYKTDLYGYERQMLEDWFRKDVLQDGSRKK
jgi:hypothetical protein